MQVARLFHFIDEPLTPALAAEVHKVIKKEVRPFTCLVVLSFINRW